MSKYVKELIVKDLRNRLSEVNDLVLVNMAGLSSEGTFRVRKELRAKQINILVVKNSMARLATQGTPLAPAFEGAAAPTRLTRGPDRDPACGCRRDDPTT